MVDADPCCERRQRSTSAPYETWALVLRVDRSPPSGIGKGENQWKATR